jgi:lipopolysaccharide transport system permease protein
MLITPRPDSAKHQISEFWGQKELVLFFAWRNLKVRYAQTVLGACWSVLQPVLSALVLALVLGRFAGMNTDGAPSFLFYMAALVPWTFFAGAAANASSSLVSNQNMIQKVYFPRLALPVAAVLSSLVDFAIGLVCMFAFIFLWRISPFSPALLLLLPCLLSAAMAAAGIGIGLAALNLQYRDVAHAVPFLLQVILYASPVLYSISSVPVAVQPFFALNPMTGVIQGFRYALLGAGQLSYMILAISLVASVAILVAGLLYFGRVERRLADFA